MSAYKEIRTEFRNLESLKKALADAGFGSCDLSASATVNGLQLQGWGGRQGQAVALRLNKSHYHGFEDTGFAWDSVSKCYKAIISTHDGYGNLGAGTLEKVQERYAYHEVVRVARSKGYLVRTEIDKQTGVTRVIARKVG